MRVIKITIKHWQKTSTKVLVIVFCALLCLSSYFIVNSYNEYLHQAERTTLARLQSISNTAAIQLSAKEQAYLINQLLTGKSKLDIQKDSVYQKIHKYLQQVATANALTEPIATLYLNKLDNLFYYITTSNDSVYFGDTYIQYHKNFKINYNTGGVIETYKDEYGNWLTAFSPILNKNNKAEAIIEVDVKFDDFIKAAKSNLLKNLFISLIIFTITTAFLLRYINIVIKFEEKSKKEIQESHELIDEKNRSIIESINYAKKIQNAILPPIHLIKKYLPNSFVLYKPKDIVSGDFYFFQTTDDEDVFYIAVADCTGHGVPGALMSMIGHDLLKNIITEKKIVMPHDILLHLNNGISEILKQDGKFDDSKDGMDIGICLINKKDTILHFAGANRPLIYFENGVLKTIKPDKKAIGGGYKATDDFTLHTLSLKNTLFYLHTDGYIDQFGGQTNKKLMTKKFTSKLNDLMSENILLHEAKLDEYIEDWKGIYEQTDDILVIGFEVL
jgi:serine phosphatase RsbU (regulator of sigma subunit)